MHAFDVLGDPVRRRLLELLVDGERSAGELTTVIRQEFGISQPAVSQHLKVLRENGFALVQPQGTRRMYALDETGLREVDDWLERYRRFWRQRLDALETEVARGKRGAARRNAGDRGAESRNGAVSRNRANRANRDDTEPHERKRA